MKYDQFIKIIIESFFEMHKSIGDALYSFYANYSRAVLDILHNGFESFFMVLIYLTAVLATFYLIMAIAILFKKRKKEIILDNGSEPFVTIQIPTYNELAALNCAQRCIDFDYPKDKIQIIIGDDSNKQEISNKIDEFASNHKGIVEVTRRGKNIGFKPGNLNHMYKSTKGEFIVIFDSDFLPEKDFLKRIIAPFLRDNNISVVQAKWRIDNFNQNVYSVLGGTISLLCHNIALRFITWYGGNSFLCGSAEAIRKKDLDNVGGWLSGSLTEDIECSLRLIKKGKKLIYLENLECGCEAPQTFRDLCKQQMRWGFGVITAFKIHLSEIFRSRKTLLKDKYSVLIFASGYLFSFLLLFVTIVGILSVISNRPAPIDWALFLSITLKNIAITSGFLISSIIALATDKKISSIPKMIVGALSVGLLVTYNVNIGIFKAIFNRQMQWFMLKKNGNQIR